MPETVNHQYPKAIANVTRLDLGGETILYDKNTCRTYSLNATSMLIWQHCDGQTNLEQLEQYVTRQGQSEGADAIVQLALDRLVRVGLVVGPARAPATDRITRRHALKRAALIGAGMALPAVIAVLAPTPAQAGSCGVLCSPLSPK
jgi:Coenzyme PQQ synthesis protein D (PqqD)